MGKGLELRTTRTFPNELDSATTGDVEYVVSHVVEVEGVGQVAAYIVLTLLYNKAACVLVAANDPGRLLLGRSVAAVVGTLGKCNRSILREI